MTNMCVRGDITKVAHLDERRRCSLIALIASLILVSVGTDVYFRIEQAKNTSTCQISIIEQNFVLYLI